jgi:redox-sensitive bicupin YhaK (pirin superfamily)
MNTIYHPSAERGHVNFGWLDSHHSFSFGNWHDREKVHFGALRVLNDDVLRGGEDFDSHSYENMEVISIPLKGTLAYKDGAGTEGILSAGDVQIASASLRQRLLDPYDQVHLLQIWIFPKQPGMSPRHDQRAFHPDDRKNQWQMIVSPRAEDHALWINQDARLALTSLSAGKTLVYQPAFPSNGIYLFVLEGNVTTEGRCLGKRDGLGIVGVDRVSVSTDAGAEILAIEVPMFA